MLETIREFAAERLPESVNTHELMAKHAAYFLALAEREEGLARGMEESASSRRLEADLDNLRVAHETAVSSGDADAALRLAGALHPFWYHSSRFAEGERRSTQALALGGANTARAKALGAAGELAMLQGKLETARRHFE
jgi:predicted ATPase